MKSARQVAVVTGANRGLGLEVCRQLAQRDYQVVLTSRDSSKGNAARDTLAASGLTVDFCVLDVSSVASVDGLGRYLSRYSQIDALINNAGVSLEHHEHDRPLAASARGGDLGLVERTFNINALGALRVAQTVIPMMRSGGCIVNVSSGMGQLTGMEGGWPGYRMSKCALNAVTRMLAGELQAQGIKVNSVCPGWVPTDMGGPRGTRSVEEGAAGIVWAATLGADGPSGGFFRDRRPIPW